MSNKLAGIATLFAASSILAAGTPTLGAKAVDGPAAARADASGADFGADQDGSLRWDSGRRCGGHRCGGGGRRCGGHQCGGGRRCGGGGHYCASGTCVAGHCVAPVPPPR
jgi:hypothetical protein